MVKRVFRARGEVVLAVLFAALAVVTFLWPTWIESLFEVDPDGGTGETEWGIVVLFGVVAVVSALLARRDFRAAARGPDALPEGS